MSFKPLPKTLFLFFAQIVGGHTVARKLLYAESLDNARAMAVSLYDEDYARSNYTLIDTITKEYKDPLECELGLGCGESIANTLHPDCLLEFLRDFSKCGYPSRRGSNFTENLRDELKYQETKEKNRIAERAKTEQPGRNLDREETESLTH